MTFILAAMNKIPLSICRVRTPHRTIKELCIHTQSFVPKSPPVEPIHIIKLQNFVNDSKKLLVLTGAGLSTESGIPDYRSEGVGLYARSNSKPIQYSEFLNSEERRKIYWARNYVGFPRFSSFKPNTSHKVLADWEKKGKIHWLVTQNVDNLHAEAGTKNLTELHGCGRRVVCLKCRSLSTRSELQPRIHAMNPLFEADALDIAPDGDVLIPGEDIKSFRVPDCIKCGGILKPDVIFFGDNVPRPIVNFVFKKVDECDAVLVAGSSLYVYSGYRFVARAHDQNKPIAIVNIGTTRADHLASLKIDARLGNLLPQIEVD